MSDLNIDSVAALTRRLDAIISLMVEYDPTSHGSRSAADQSVRLVKAGLRPSEIATITGRHVNNVSRDLSAARKDGRIPKSVK